MVRSRSFPTWCLIAAGSFSGCRLGYDEIFVDGSNAAGHGGTSISGGSGGVESRAGEAGADARGGSSVAGGSGGLATSGGGSATGGEGGAVASGGSGGAGESGASTGGESGGNTGGQSGGAAGISGEATSGASGEPGEGGAGDGGTGGVSGGGGTNGGLGSGGFAGASSLGDCQTGMFGEHDYVFCNVNLAWTVARDNCASIGMSLVRVDDAAESQWVHDNVYDAPPRQGVWIGASDAAVEGEWRWVDGTLFWLGDSAGTAQDGLFAAWYSTQPSGQDPRDCAAVDGNTLGWYDLDCMTPQPYVCESP